MLPSNPQANELESLLALRDFSPIYKQADQVRNEHVGDVVHIRAILEFSNYCRRKCSYCGLNSTNTGAQRFRMTPEEMVDAAKSAHDAGYKTLVMQSGEDPFFTPELLGDIIREIKKTGIKITVSCGEMPYETYAHLKECGADRYLLKHETAAPQLYGKLHPCGTLSERVRCLRDLKSLGYETGSGFMIGLPGQTLSTIAQDLLLLADIPCDMAGIGPFIAHPDTPLRGAASGSAELTRRAVALARILLPKCNLPATTALGVVDGEEKTEVFSGGANVIMQKVTPSAYKRLYEIYPMQFTPTDVVAQRAALEAQIRSLGRIPL